MYFATAKEMELLDRISVEQGLEIRQMMELAGWHMVSLFETLKIPKTKKVLVVAGQGNKGGDGLAAARHLVNHGWNVSVMLMSRAMKKDPKHHLKLLERMNVGIREYDGNMLGKSVVIIDALIGYHLEGQPRGLYKEAIEAVNKSNAFVISYDLPSGLDATTGACAFPCVQADATLTLALPKRAFRKADAKRQSGKIFLADLGIPAFLYNEVKKGSRPSFGNPPYLISL